MTLIRTSFLNGIAVVVKMLTLLGLNKLLAIYIGPAGYASLGQFQNAMTMITTFASGAINTGVTKYTAEYYDDELRQRSVWRTAGSIALVGSLITSVLITVFSKPLAGWFLKDESYSGVFYWFSATLVFFVFNALLLAILNGKKDIARYVLANIAGSLFALVITSVLAITYKLYGALIALAIYQSISFFVTLSLCYKAGWFKFKYFIGDIDKGIAKDLAGFALMALTSAICVPVSHIFIRSYLGEAFGWDMAGYWEAMWRLSGAYLMLVTTTLSVYYLPRLSELSDFHEIKQEIIQGYKIILPVAAFCGLSIYIFRDFLIGLLFSEQFSPMRELFAWQMVGDTLKIGSWILAYLMLGKAMVRYFVITEITFSMSFYFFVLTLTKVFGFSGVAWAYAINYLIYWIVMYFMVFKSLKFQGDVKK